MICMVDRWHTPAGAGEKKNESAPESEKKSGLRLIEDRGEVTRSKHWKGEGKVVPPLVSRKREKEEGDPCLRPMETYGPYH